jgi:hypothetical protein
MCSKAAIDLIKYDKKTEKGTQRERDLETLKARMQQRRDEINAAIDEIKETVAKRILEIRKDELKYAIAALEVKLG